MESKCGTVALEPVCVSAEHSAERTVDRGTACYCKCKIMQETRDIADREYGAGEEMLQDTCQARVEVHRRIATRRPGPMIRNGLERRLHRCEDEYKSAPILQQPRATRAGAKCEQPQRTLTES